MSSQSVYIVDTSWRLSNTRYQVGLPRVIVTRLQRLSLMSGIAYGVRVAAELAEIAEKLSANSACSAVKNEGLSDVQAAT
jgi:hypothetical protein